MAANLSASLLNMHPRVGKLYGECIFPEVKLAANMVAMPFLKLSDTTTLY